MRLTTNETGGVQWCNWVCLTLTFSRGHIFCPPSRADNALEIKAFSMITMLVTISETRGVQWCNRFCLNLTFSRGHILRSRADNDLEIKAFSMITMLLTISQTRGVQCCKRFCSTLTFSRGHILTRVRTQIMSYKLKRPAWSECVWVTREKFRGSIDFS